VISEHTRPIDCTAYDEQKRQLYTGDSMGVIKSWRLDLPDDSSSCRPALLRDYGGHRTGVNNMITRNSDLWSGMLCSRHI
jgi:hypothetical protein